MSRPSHRDEVPPFRSPVMSDEAIDTAAEFAMEVQALQTVDTEVLKKALQRRGLAVLGTIPELEQQLTQLRNIEADKDLKPLMPRLLGAIDKHGWNQLRRVAAPYLEDWDDEAPVFFDEYARLVPS